MRQAFSGGISFLEKVALSALLISGLMTVPALAQPVIAESPAVRATFFDNGQYEVHCRKAGWTMAGRLPTQPNSVARVSGTDKLGPWQELNARDSQQVSAIRVYLNRPVVLFREKRLAPGRNNDSFPHFGALPTGLMEFSYGVNNFAKYQFGKLGAEGPWMFFNKQSQAMVLSPADHFLVSNMTAGPDGVEIGGIVPTIQTLPAGFQHETLLVLGTGMGATLNAWGQVLQTLNGKLPVPNDADVILNKFGYWTDHFATYYYNTDYYQEHAPKLGYEGTLLAMRDAYKRLGVPIAYMQLDSWWYLRGTDDISAPMLLHGELLYRANPKFLPGGLKAFHKKMGLPFAVHARWIAPNSPYRHQYRMSRNVILSQEFWNKTAKYLRNSGVAMYEQDWLDDNARPEMNLTDPQEFLGNMSRGMETQNIAIQYCMPFPAYYMASTRYQNLETIRVSDDGFKRSLWDDYLYGSAFARAVGLWPWSDVYMSHETPELILSTLSGGPVGVGDALGEIDAENLKRVMRKDSVLLKPDTSIVPVDAMYMEDATTPDAPMVAATHSGDVIEVFSYPRRRDMAQTTIPLLELGIAGPAYAYDWVHHTGSLIPAGGSFPMKYDQGWAYTVLAPIDMQGTALLGDVDDVVPLAAKRFSANSGPQGIRLKTTFVIGEDAVPVTGYAAKQPTVMASQGNVSGVQYDPATHMFKFLVHPASGTATVRQAVVNIR